MARLVVNPGSADSWEIQLKPGTNLLGRDASNDFQIADDSVSGCHCQIQLEDGHATLTDLGSTNGTFVDHEQVVEATLHPGQLVNLGEVELAFYSDFQGQGRTAIPPSSPPPPIPVRIAALPVALAPSDAPGHCKFHPKTASRFYCPHCRQSFCEICVNSHPVAGTMKKFCRACGVECTPLQVRPQASPQISRGFARAIPGAFLYPFNGDGLVLLATGTVCYALIGAASFFAKFAFLYGAAAMLLMTIMAGGYFTGYLRRILTSSAMGEDTMPDWPDFSDFGTDIMSPFLQLLGTVLVSFLPYLILALFVDTELAWTDWALGAAYLFGCIYFPMAFLAVAMLDSVLAVNPFLIVPSIVKIWLEYFLLVLLFGAVMALRWASGLAAHALLPPNLLARLLTSVISGFLGFYLLIVEVRILGLLYRSKKSALGWFNR